MRNQDFSITVPPMDPNLRGKEVPNELSIQKHVNINIKGKNFLIKIL